MAVPTQRMTAPNFSAAVIPAKTLIPVARISLWVIAILLFGVSLLGNYVQFTGGWQYWLVWSDAAKRALIYAIAWQVMCSLLQFSFLYTRVWWAYFAFLAASVTPSLLSYYPAAAPTVAAWFLTQGLPSGFDVVLAALIVGGGAVVLDWLPERILVKR